MKSIMPDRLGLSWVEQGSPPALPWPERNRGSMPSSSLADYGIWNPNISKLSKNIDKYLNNSRFQALYRAPPLIEKENPKVTDKDMEVDGKKHKINDNKSNDKNNTNNVKRI